MRHSSVKRVAVLGALCTALGVAAPVASASAAGTPVVPAELAAFPFPGFTPGAFTFGTTALSGQDLTGAVSGAVIITTAPTSFVNTNNQTSPEGNFTGGQVTP
jgi:hypothetical protein